MGEIVISIDSQAIERAIYWIVILVLAGLLLWSYFGNNSCDSGENITAAATQGTTTAAESEEELTAASDEPAPEEEPEETCFDGIKNQYETDVDCGGDCDQGCDEGDACFRDRDCDTDLTCVNKVCTAGPTLSGKIEFSVTDVKTQKADSGAIKVTSFTVKIVNGKQDNFFGSVTAYAKSSSGVYLNQFGDTTYDYSPYIGPSTLEKVAPGETKIIRIDEAGTYIFDQTGYSLGGSFKLAVELYDGDEKKIDEISKTVS